MSRQEARQWAWKALSKIHRDALVGIFDKFCAFPAPADFNQENPIFFIDGERGTGKTTLLLTLQGMLKPQGPDSLPDEKEPKSVPGLRQRIVTLAPLQMDTLSSGVDIFAALSARLHQCLNASYAADDRGYVPEDIQKARIAARKIATLGQLSAYPNLSDRASHADLDSYVSEVLRVEEARLTGLEELNKALKIIAAALAANKRWKMTGELQFLLLLDDFDLNPSEGLMVLRKLHLLRSPYLICLACGHRQTTETFFTLQMLRGLGDATDKAVRLVDDRMIVSTRELAANALRKLVPPNSTVRLPPFDLSSTDYRESCKDVKTRLEAIGFTTRAMTGKSFDSNFFEAARANKVTFTARQWQDFKDAVFAEPEPTRKDLKAARPRKVAWAVAREAKMRLGEASGLDGEELRLATDAIGVRDMDDGFEQSHRRLPLTATGPDDPGSDAAHFWLDSARFHAKGLEAPVTVMREEGRCRVELIARQRMKLAISKETMINRPAGDLVALLSDLLRVALEEEIPGPEYHGWFVRTIWYVNERKLFPIPWDPPPWQTFAQIRAFERLWTRCCEWVAWTKDSYYSMHYAWLALGQAIVGGHPITVGDTLEDYFDHPQRSIKDPQASPLLPIIRKREITKEDWEQLAAVITFENMPRDALRAEWHDLHEWLLRVSLVFSGGTGAILSIWQDHFRVRWARLITQDNLLYTDLQSRLAVRQRSINTEMPGAWETVIAPNVAKIDPPPTDPIASILAPLSRPG